MPAGRLRPHLSSPWFRQATSARIHWRNFPLLRQSVDRFKTQVDQKVLSLNLEDRRAQKKDDEEFKKRLEGDLTRLAKSDFAKHEVKLDAVIAAEAAGQKPAPATPADGDTDGVDEDTAAAKLDIHMRTLRRCGW